MREIRESIPPQQKSLPELKSSLDGRILSVKKELIAAILAAAPMVGCGTKSDLSDNLSSSNIPTQNPTVETASQDLRRSILQFDGKKWYFYGNYPEDFQLQVYATNVPGKKPTFENSEILSEELVEVVDTDTTEIIPENLDNNFFADGPVENPQTTYVLVKAFNEETGEEIDISGQPGDTGMSGNFAFPNPNLTY